MERWLLTVVLVISGFTGTLSNRQGLVGLIDECECNIDTINNFNNYRIYPQIQNLVSKDYFRYFRVDLSRPCPFWIDDSKCALKDCSVETCPEDSVPFVVYEKLRTSSGGSGDLDEYSGDVDNKGDVVKPVKLETTGNQEAVKEKVEPSQATAYYERAKTVSEDATETVAMSTAEVVMPQDKPMETKISPSSVQSGDDKTVYVQDTPAPTAQTVETSKYGSMETSKDAAEAGETRGKSYQKRSLKSSSESEKESCDEHNQTLGKIDGTISEESRLEFEHWRKHDDKLKNFCVFDDEKCANASYVDLLLNPERFTGYTGPSATRVWKSIYEENCFKPPQGSLLNLNQLCLEKRVFYRAISGLHTSINIHLCADYYLPKVEGRIVLPGEKVWGPNLDEFERRFAPQFTNGEGPRRLRNLYFVYLLEMRAIAKVADYLETEAPFYTSREEDTEETRRTVGKFLQTVREFDGHFNESQMFIGSGLETLKMKEEFRLHFLNISTIMDCVGCDKCRLWGKLQTQGLGTALKILFSGEEQLPLSRTEIVTLFNAFSRLSNSILQLDNFNRMQDEREKNKGQGGGRSPFGVKVEL